MKHTLFIWTMFILLFSLPFGKGRGWAVAQFIGGNADGHSLVSKTDVAVCTLPTYLTSTVGTGGNADGHSLVSKTDVAICTLPAYLTSTVATGGIADGHSLVSQECGGGGGGGGCSDAVGLWHFNNNWLDSSGNASHGTANGGATFGTAKFGPASGSFDGVGDYISIPDNENWNFGNGDFTYQTWVKFNTSPAGWPNTMALYDQFYSSRAMAIYVDNQYLRFAYSTNGSASIDNIYQPFVPTTGVWYHIVVLRNGSNIRFFVNGSQLGSDINIGAVTIFNSTVAVWLGASHTGAGGNTPEGELNGFLDEVAIWKRALTAAEITTLYNWNGNGNGCYFLPIELLSFTATLQSNNTVLCQWKTASEINNDYFTVEKTKDDIQYEFVGQVKGAGNSSITLNYELIDTHPYQGTSYYRLKQTDYDGKYKYSDLVPVNLKGINIISIAPNPAEDKFEYKIGSTEKMSLQVKVVDILGQIVINKTENIEQGISNHTLLVSGLSSGTYILQLITENKEVIGKQFQIK